MQFVGKGIYSYSECARFLGISRQRVSGWYRGWPKGSDRLIQSEYDGLFEHPTISFLDFVDASVALTLTARHGVSIQMIRKLRRKLAEVLDTTHPFARKDFFILPTRRPIVFSGDARTEGDYELIEVLEQQHAFPELMLPFLSRVEYDEVTRYAQVFPLLGSVVLDPRRKYGKPIVRGTGMPTAILYECFRETQSEDEVADWYNVTAEDVLEAVRFETEFSGIAA